ncbi:unnamed protein product [Trifolium pratense]|uniref:Uncharacterized protein n=1 Tax=Trifolium pratense TaxID=57577 RepID=A0ACB0IPK6_TRIPR|nr:unnamed protein product [Trifolium pratense]
MNLEANQIRLSALVSFSECKRALFDMGPHKAPGEDGYPAMFFQQCWDTIANSLYQLKPLLDGIISPYQSSFIPGRTIHHNIIVAQEMVHSMAKMKGKRMFMSIKIDLEKAYDRLNWNFIENCMTECKFPSKLISIIHYCITSPSFRILWNGDKTDNFSPTRGIRQGDPLSPYLFVICMERLSHIIADQVEANYWKPMRAGKSGPQISHLLFADDLLLFAEASIEQAHCVMHCLDQFCQASGQRINNQKTQIFFSKNVDQQLKGDILQHTGFTQVDSLGKYLEANIAPGRTTRGKFEHIISKMQNRLSGWKHQCLSFAGRLTLTKSVLSSIPYYHMQYAKILKTLCDEMEKIQRGFLWGDTEQKRRPHLISWDVCCLPKKAGGLGIKSPHQMNDAFLMKILWNMINKPDNLWCKDQFQNHTVWQLGDGKNINFWLDKWAPCGSSLMLNATQQFVDTTLTVKDVVTINGHWNIDFIKAHLPPDKANQVLAIPAPMEADGPDSLGWKGTSTRHFTVQSAYEHQCQNLNHIEGDWQKIWDWKGPHKLQNFMWIAAHERLLTNYRQSRWRIGVSPICPSCGNGDETLLHVLRDCVYATQEDIHRPTDPIRVILDLVQAIDRGGHLHLIRGSRRIDTIYIGWKRPQGGWVKLNCDGAYKESLDLAGCGGLIRDCDGQWRTGYTRKIGTCDALHAEMWGMYEGLKIARRQGFSHIIVESDSKLLVDMVTNNCQINGATPVLIRRIRDLINLSWHVQVNHTLREGNRCADWLASYSLTNDSFFPIVLEAPPRELQSISFDDISGACMPRNQQSSLPSPTTVTTVVLRHDRRYHSLFNLSRRPLSLAQYLSIHQSSSSSSSISDEHKSYYNQFLRRPPPPAFFLASNCVCVD